MTFEDAYFKKKVLKPDSLEPFLPFVKYIKVFDEK